MGPVPLRENGQLGKPGMLPLPVTLTVRFDPLTCPVPVPEMLALPRHTAVNVPAMSVSDWVVTVQTKFEQLAEDVAEAAAAGAIDDQVPIIDGIVATEGCVGESADVVEPLLRCKSHAAAATTAIEVRSERRDERAERRAVMRVSPGTGAKRVIGRTRRDQ
jgi:hypothetical protein